jgi:hypothetical protein
VLKWALGVIAAGWCVHRLAAQPQLTATAGRRTAPDLRVVGPWSPVRPRLTLEGMFVRYFVELPLPAAQVERALLGSPGTWLSALARSAQRRGDGLLTEVGVGPLGARLGRRVAVQLREPVRLTSMTSLPLTWEPVGLDGLLHRVAEATVKDFLDRVGEAICASPAGGAVRR